MHLAQNSVSLLSLYIEKGVALSSRKCTVRPRGPPSTGPFPYFLQSFLCPLPSLGRASCHRRSPGSEIETSSLRLGDLARQAIHAGLTQVTYISEVTPEFEVKLTKELCFPEKCFGHFVELFSSSTCNASPSLGSLELLPHPNIRD